MGSCPSRGRVGMYCLIAAESAIFTIFRRRLSLLHRQEPEWARCPARCSTLPIFLTICLLSSSLTIHFAVAALRAGEERASSVLWWAFTIGLGAVFLGGTAREWHHLIYDEGLTIRTNLFGTILLLPSRAACVSRHGRPAGLCQRC